MHPVASALLAWYDRSARVLPWRGIRDPYRTWVSEVMLQQTRVETVLPYYGRFLARFPDLPALAAADEAEVLKLWEGLGYYSRARNLHSGARIVMHDFGGNLPADVDLLRSLPGVGPYMAGAIASIAFSIPVPAVDGNVIRVVSRLFGVRDDAGKPAVRRKIDDYAASIVPEDRPGDHNQAMMDIGSSVCVPGTPDCTRCPLSAFCDAFARGDAADLPRLPKARPQKLVPWTVLIIRSGDRILLRQRTEKLLQGLWCFPMIAGHLKKEDVSSAVFRSLDIRVSDPRARGDARHVFTHQVWEMRLYSVCAAENAVPPDGYEFVHVDALKQKTLPAAMNAAVRVVRITDVD